MPHGGRTRAGLQQVFNRLVAALRRLPVAVADAPAAVALTVFPLIKVVSKLPLCCKNLLDSSRARRQW
ncbi:hypothetical protein BN2475_460064 [Paraburkholderia ribeironis]|uniref:Uncharacterized protein n=1 Tax=Paraburkholderia ribeironis TaxID=1247936 RepID=A0A1N7S9Q7_9BURK|nr:hypothetical protein BN2475_460064 [Paraburkholderia ribeironis]